jgi:natural product biosynthesis luciferase-like monooxygenase protein
MLSRLYITNFNMDFSLFFFSNYKVRSDNKYHLLLESARFADRHGFKAVWTPERHFHEFGGLFPNPSVTSAALAMITSRLELRSGSVVSPLHDAVRIAEEWSVVDNLSRGRVALSFASGWNGNDFALAKDRYANRHQMMNDQINDVRKLWKGGSLKRKNGLGKEVDFRIFPSPVQQELPIWITAAGNEQTYIQAGEMGVNLLTHLLGQEMEELSEKITAYRKARIKSGYPPDTGRVALMLHTYIGEDMTVVESLVEKPFIEYLKSATSLSRILYEEAGLKAEDIPEEDKEMMLKMSFKRYSRSSALIGTLSSCSAMVKRLEGIGVDEIACLADFGIEQDKVLEGLVKLNELQQLHKKNN